MGAGLTQTAAAPPASLAVRGLGKTYASAAALLPTDLDVAAGEFLTLLGPSGSGKTTLLSMVAGLVPPTQGRVLLAGEDVTAWPAWRRGIGVVFQSYALFPHMTVAENVAFPLRMRRVAGAAAREAVAAALRRVRLEAFAGRMPRELSGGQQQRVAVARAVVFRPPLVLMDEPLGALDRGLREELKGELRRLHRELGATVLYVTHDQDEAMALSDRICVMDRARVRQVGTPSDLYDRPRSRFVAEFLGRSNLFSAPHAGTLGLDPGGKLREGDLLLLRPERIVPGVVPGALHLEGDVEDAVNLGAAQDWTARLADGTRLRVTTLRPPPPPGSPVTLSVAPQDLVAVAAEADAAGE